MRGRTDTDERSEVEMDEVETAGGDENIPLFDTYRRGYDPEQVDRYLEDQQRRFNEMTRRAYEAERRLGQAMDQLHAMNRRLSELEQREPSPPQAAPTVPIDLLGDRIQRILQEAWDGAFALRQSVESEVAQIREQAVSEATRIVEEAKAKAHGIENQMRRRREAYLQRAEQDKAKAVAQMTFLSDQRKAAIAELIEIKERIESAIVDVPTQTAANLTLVSSSAERDGLDIDEDPAVSKLNEWQESIGHHPSAGEPPREEPPREDRVLKFGETELPPTMAVHRLPSFDTPRPADTSSLVRSHRQSAAREQHVRPESASPPPRNRVFDIEADDNSTQD